MNDKMKNIPTHIAIIMDGNRRWAKKHGVASAMGHKEGEKVFHKIVQHCSDMGIKILTVYAFSTENWKRSAEEVGILMNLFEFYMKEERKYLLREKIQFRILGDKDELPPSLKKEFEITERETSKFNGMTLNLAVNYSSRSEILKAAKEAAKQVKSGSMTADDITEDVFSGLLTTSGQPDPDLLIRTSGEERLSNFLLWQCAYSELYFTDVLWPDFTEEHLNEAIKSYQFRNRRFGGGAA